MDDRRRVAMSTYSLNGTRRPPDAILDDWKNYLRKVFNRSRRADRWPETVEEAPQPPIPLKYTIKRLSGDPVRSAPAIPASMFGRRLEASVDGTSGVATFVLWCVEAIVTTGDGLDTDAIYRASANQKQVQQIAQQGENGMKQVLKRVENINVLTGALKLFFRQLPTPLMNYDDFNRALQSDSPVEKLRHLVQGLPAHERNTLTFMMSHLQDVLHHEDENKMCISGLAIVFGPTLMRISTNPHHMAFDMKQQNCIIEFLLSKYDTIFPHDSRRDALAILDVHQQQQHTDSSDSDTGSHNKHVVDITQPGINMYNAKSSDEDENHGETKTINNGMQNGFSQKTHVGDQLYFKTDKNQSVLVNEPQRKTVSEASENSYDDSKITIPNKERQSNYYTNRLSSFTAGPVMSNIASQSQQQTIPTGVINSRPTSFVSQTHGQATVQQKRSTAVTVDISKTQLRRSEVSSKDVVYADVQKKSERKIRPDAVNRPQSIDAPPKLPSTAPPVNRIYRPTIYNMDTYDNRKTTEVVNSHNHSKTSKSQTAEYDNYQSVYGASSYSNANYRTRETYQQPGAVSDLISGVGTSDTRHSHSYQKKDFSPRHQQSEKTIASPQQNVSKLITNRRQPDSNSSSSDQDSVSLN